jgi:hypothetical protein
MAGSAGVVGAGKVRPMVPAGWGAMRSENAAVDGPLIAPEISRAIVMTYRGWHSFEKANGGPDVVDFDLSDLEGESEFRSRLEVLETLEGLQEQLSSGRSHEAEFLSARLHGSLAYLRTLMGEQIPFDAYIRATLGIDAKPFSSVQVLDARSKLQSLLHSVGLELDASSRPAYENKFLLDPEEIKSEILKQKDLWLGRLAEASIPVPGHLPFAVEFAEVDAYWSNWIAGSYRKGMTLTINLHKRNRYDKGRALFLCLHEICGHAVQMSIWRERIAAGEISQACGITNVHSCESFVAEGLGQTVPDFLSQYEFSTEFELGRALRYYTLLVLHNAHLELYAGRPVRELVAELAEKLPLSEPDELLAQIKDRGTNPLYRTYLLSYATGETTIKELIEADPGKKTSLFRAIYTTPMTPRQLIALQQ